MFKVMWLALFDCWQLVLLWPLKL